MSTRTQAGATRRLATLAAHLRAEALPDGLADLLILADLLMKCVLDWIGVTAGGAEVGKLLNFDTDHFVSAFGIAASMVSGSTQYLHSGSWNKRVHAGIAARNGIFAATLANAG